MERLFTVGVYGYDAPEFFEALQQAKIDLLLDLRRRRGVRGRQYSFANAGRLQQELEARGVAYRHVIGLAPEPVTRELQNEADVASKLPKRQRAVLADSFVADYTQRTLEPFDWDRLVRDLEAFQWPALFCVERTPEACHRHLVAARLAVATGVPITHLMP